MCERRRDREERDWADREPSDQERDTDTEKTYRDGSLINECWNHSREEI